MKCIRRHKFIKLGKGIVGKTMQKHVECIKCNMHILIIHPACPRNEWINKEPLRYERKILNSKNSEQRELKRFLLSLDISS